MAQYKTHAKFNLLLLMPLFLLIFKGAFDFSNYQIGFFIGSYVYGTLFMNPDLDLANKIRLFSLRGFLTLPFRSYSLFFRHRGLSHSILFGTLTRTIWLFMILFLIFFGANLLFGVKDSFTPFIKNHSSEIVFLFLGVALADICHIILDKITDKC